MRLFVAVDLPEEVKKKIGKIQQDIRHHGDFSFVKPEQEHMTLKFLGEVVDAEDVKESLRQVDFKNFSLETGEIGFFPNEKNIRVVWLGIKESKELEELAKQVRKALPGFKEDHPFHAHITIARAKHIGKAFPENIPETDTTSFEVSSFKLMKSTLTSKGPVYEVVEEYT